MTVCLAAQTDLAERLCGDWGAAAGVLVQGKSAAHSPALTRLWRSGHAILNHSAVFL